MDAIFMMLVKQLGPYATMTLFVGFLWYKIKAIENCKTGCQEKVRKMEQLILKNDEEASTKYALSSECKIVVNNVLTHINRLEKRIDTSEKVHIDNYRELSAKQDANTDKIIQLIMKGYKNE